MGGKRKGPTPRRAARAVSRDAARLDALIDELWTWHHAAVERDAVIAEANLEVQRLRRELARAAVVLEGAGLHAEAADLLSGLTQHASAPAGVLRRAA